MPAWSDQERNKMFLAMIELMAPHGSNNKLPSWALVAERMQSGFTGEAVRQQFQKCRKEGLPRQPHPTRGTSGGVSKTRYSRNGKRFSSRCGEYDDDEEASLYSTSKKIKKEYCEGDKYMMGGLSGGIGSGLTNDGPGIGGTKRAVLKKEEVDENGVVQMEDEEE